MHVRARVNAALSTVLVSGCVVRSAPPQQNPGGVEIVAPIQSPRAPMEQPAILSAHFAIDDAPPLDGADALPVVFNVEIDASTVVPEHFIVAREDGSRARPTGARLSPANESDENRTVLLTGDFGGPKDRPPTNVAVSGAVYSEAGASLRGLASDVLAFTTPPTVVYAELLTPAEGRCADAGSAVRTYWTEGLRALDPASTGRFSIGTDDGGSVQAASFDDQGVPGEDGADDNVLDVCVAEEGRPVRLRVEAGVLTDPVGHANAAVDVDIALPPA